jgi:hypothetical protein
MVIRVAHPSPLGAAMRHCSGALALLALASHLTADDHQPVSITSTVDAATVIVTAHGAPIAVKPFHASVIQSRVEAAIEHTVNYLRDGAPRPNPEVTVRWSCQKVITVFSQVDGTKEIAMTHIEFQDFGPGVNDIGDILILASDADGNVYRCEKYDPGFCDEMDAVARLHFAK